LEVVDAVVLAVEAGEDRDEARVGDVEGAPGVAPDVALAGQAVDRRREARLPSPGAQGVGAQGVDADHEDVRLRRPGSRRQGLAAVERRAAPEGGGEGRAGGRSEE